MAVIAAVASVVVAAVGVETAAVCERGCASRE